jgi:hypothetical protein
MLIPDRTIRIDSYDVVNGLRFPHAETIRKSSSVFVCRCYGEKKKKGKEEEEKRKKEQCFFENPIVTLIIH